MVRIVAAFAIVHSTVTLASGDETWSRFRGPNGSGVSASSHLPTEFGLDQNLHWKTPLPTGHSSPVLNQDKIFLTATEDKTLLTICLDRESGKLLWQQEAPRNRQEKLDPRNHPASPSPVVDDTGVYVFFPDYGLIAYTSDGREQWKLEQGPFTNIYGMGTSPIIVDDLIVLVCDQSLNSYVIAVEKETGSIKWRVPRPEATSGHCSPIVFRPDGGRPAQIIVPGSFYLTAYTAKTGKKLWWVGGLCFEMKSTPVIDQGIVYINGYGSPQNQPDQKVTVDSYQEVLAAKDSDRNGKLALTEMPNQLATNFFPAIDLDNSGSLDESEWEYFQASLASENSMMAIRLDGQGDMTQTNLLWKYQKNIPQLPSPIVYQDRLYMISDRGIVTCLDPRNGLVVKRGRLEGAAGNVYASPVAADDKIFFTTLEGNIAVVQPGDELRVLAVNDLGEKCYATPAIAHNRIYVRTETALYCFAQSE